MGVCVFVCVSADGVDGAIIGEASESHVVVYKQMEQKFISANKKNSVNNKFHKTFQYLQQ